MCFNFNETVILESLLLQYVLLQTLYSDSNPVICFSFERLLFCIFRLNPALIDNIRLKSPQMYALSLLAIKTEISFIKRIRDMTLRNIFKVEKENDDISLIKFYNELQEYMT